MSVSTHLELNTGALMPSVGYGTWQAGGEELESALNMALEAGYRHIDTATVYTNEEIVGKVINEWISSERLSRSDLFIVTKLPPAGNSSKGVDKYLKESLEKLNLDYIDLYLIHVPFGFKEGGELYPMGEDGNIILEPNTSHMSTWTAMERYVKDGKVKAIGLSNFNQEQIDRIWNNGEIKPANLQIEMHLFHQQKDLLQYCQSKGIVVTAYSPLGSRGLGELFQSIGSSQELPDLFAHPEVQKISESLGKSPAQILLRFLLQKGVAIIPKSTSEAHIKSNLKVFDFEIGEEFFETLEGLDQRGAGRIVDFSFLKGADKHPEFPFRNL
ncbi:hypothetical protein GE061_000251 [Apolygus lucorum]|uniref:NADP-dependent oxidoreductase domain-containing protein n=1 Tax=Apolygus lucorum TaxID=248454 RepID=A0A6A4K5T3_APOLU|nr:hypothetical protein GE061_000251 [Apolygus lucorum]